MDMSFVHIFLNPSFKCDDMLTAYGMSTLKWLIPAVIVVGNLQVSVFLHFHVFEVDMTQDRECLVFN